MEMKFKTHTIIMLVGATECGKTTFAKKVLLPQLQYEDTDKNFKMNVQYLSSDDIRRDILGHELDKYDSTMLESSKLAFDLFNKKLDVVTQYPVSAEFVVLDTTGLSEMYRKEIVNYAKKNNYNLDVIVFDYTDDSDYFSTDRSKRLVDNHVRRLKREVLPNLRQRDYNQIHRIRRKDFLNEDGTGNWNRYNITIENKYDYVDNFLPHKYEYMVVGDVHEHVEGLKDLLKKKKFIFDGDKIIGNEYTDSKRIVLVGDWIDKGDNTKEIVNFLYENKDWFVFVMGNHENFVGKYMNGEIKGTDTQVIKDYFTSIEFLPNMKNEFVYNKAKEIFDLAKPFAIYRGVENKSFIVTHAPCNNKYLGKMDKRSIREQRVIRFEDRENKEEKLKFLESESEFNYPYHIFGHVPSKEVIRVNNKLGIDTGAVNGNKLTCVEITYRPFFDSVKTKRIGNNEKIVPHLFKKKKESVKWKDLSHREKRSIYAKSEQKINFISGTMSPADADKENNILESLDKGLDYYKNKGIDKVILQPKYMGSRCNLYLNRDADKSYGVSRNGFSIKRVDLEKVFRDMSEKFKWIMEEEDIEWLVLDGELLPWRALGEGLIDKSFAPMYKAVESEIEFLRKHGFDEQIERIMKEKEDTDFGKEASQMSKKKLIKKYGDAKYRNYSGLNGFNHVKCEEHEDMIKVFKEQVDLFSVEDEIHYKPFNVLKMIKTDGEELFVDDIGNAEQVFRLVSDDDYVVVDLDESGYKVAQKFFSELTEVDEMEGVVIKPLEEEDGVVPFMKVRNERYLTIVYGYDYLMPHKYDKLVKNKKTRGKMRTSIREHQLGRELLRVPYNEINRDNKEYLGIVKDMLVEVKKEERLDPRL